MARRLRLVGAMIDHPSEIERRNGARSVVSLGIVSDDLKGQPVHQIELTDDEALRLISDLAGYIRVRRSP